jgi:predicted outer membrane repeat protein
MGGMNASNVTFSGCSATEEGGAVYTKLSFVVILNFLLFQKYLYLNRH